jgi:hypothetical protein
MEVRTILADLRDERRQIVEAIGALEKLAQTRGKRRGRPPAWMAEVVTKKRRGRPPGSKNRPKAEAANA